MTAVWEPCVFSQAYACGAHAGNCGLKQHASAHLHAAHRLSSAHEHCLMLNPGLVNDAPHGQCCSIAGHAVLICWWGRLALSPWGTRSCT